MKKLRNRTRARFLLGLQSNIARAQRLAEFELYRGDASLLTGELAKYLAVTKADIQRVAAKYLTLPRRSTVEVTPGSRPLPSPSRASPPVGDREARRSPTGAGGPASLAPRPGGAS